MSELIHRAFKREGSRRFPRASEHGRRRYVLSQDVVLDLERRGRIHDKRVEAARLEEVSDHGGRDGGDVTDGLQLAMLIRLQGEVLAGLGAEAAARRHVRA